MAIRLFKIFDDNLEVSHYINQTIGSVNMNTLSGTALTKIRASPQWINTISCLFLGPNYEIGMFGSIYHQRKTIL